MLRLAEPFRFSPSPIANRSRSLSLYTAIVVPKSEIVNRRVPKHVFEDCTPYFGGMEGRISTRLTVVLRHAQDGEDDVGYVFRCNLPMPLYWIWD